jgi:hypothetical protein
MVEQRVRQRRVQRRLAAQRLVDDGEQCVGVRAAHEHVVGAGAQRDLLMRLAAGYRADQVAAACRMSVGELGRRLRAIVRKLQWDVRAGALTLQLA